MNHNSCEWHDVPEDSWQEWQYIFYSSKENLNLSEPCPVCKSKTLHRFYQLVRKREFILQGRKYVGDGGLWQWCSSCYSYVHATAAIPEWWSEPILEFDPMSVSHTPVAFEIALRNSDRFTH